VIPAAPSSSPPARRLPPRATPTTLLAAAFSAFRVSMRPERMWAPQILPLSWPATATGRASTPATCTTIESREKPISAASLPIGPLAPANGQTTAPLAPAVTIRLPLSKKARLLILAG